MVNGHVDERFADVRDVLAGTLASGEELGAGLYVDLDGEAVVDLHGGFRDGAATEPWTADTLVNVWSMTKTVTSLAALVLVDRGELDVDAPVADYWPEFGQAGKEGVLVRHLMSHTSGVSGWEQPFAQSDLYDREASTARLAAQAPWWEPGSASGYHAQSFGHLIGEVVHRVSGMPLAEFVARELADPVRADFRLGVPESEWGRVAEIVPPPPMEFDLEAAGPDHPMVKTFTGPITSPTAPNTPEWRAAAIGATNGFGTAQGIAGMLAAVALGGETRGVRLLSPPTIDLIFREQARGADLVLGIPLRWGIGFGLPEPATLPFIPEGRIAFWGGWGGSMAVMDVDRRMTIVYVMNKMAPGIIGSPTSAAYITAIYRALGS